MNESPVPHADALLAHADFVRTVARAALRGDREVDDVVQETWLAALQAAPREPGALRAWLGGIARRQAANRVRREAALRGRHAALPPPGAAPSAAETAARIELGRHLVDAVLALREPYRQALMLRYYEDLPPREIAQQLGLPVNTVRTHVRRGLEQLRTRLDGAYGDRPRGAVGALLAITGEVPPHVLPSLTGTVGGVIVTKKSLAVAVVLVLLAVLAWPSRWFDGEGSGGDPNAPLLTADGTAEGGGPALQGQARPATADAPPPPPSAHRAGRVVTRGTREPRRGVPVYAVPIDPTLPALVFTTDDDGWFDLVGVPPGRASVFAFGAGWVSGELETITERGFDPTVRDLPLAAGEILMIEVAPCARITGLVRDERGAPVGDASVEMLPTGIDRRPRRPANPLVVTTGSDGTFRHDAVLPGRAYAFRVSAADHPTTFVEARVFQAGGGNPPVEIRLSAGRSIPVSVVDAASGAGVADVAVHADWTDGERGEAGVWTTDASGRVEVGPVPRTRVRLTVERGGYLAPAEPTWVPATAPGTAEATITLTLDPGQVLAGSVVGATGLDLHRVEVEAHARGPYPSSATFPVDAEGRFEIRGLVRGSYRIVATLLQRGAWYVGTVEATAPGFGHRIELARSNDPFPDESDAIKRDVGEVALRVLSPSGTPLRCGWIRFADDVVANAVDLEDGPPRILVARNGAGVRFEVSDLGTDEHGAPLGAGQYGPARAVGGVLTLQLEAGETIRGRVVGGGTGGVRGVQVRALPKIPFDRDPDPQGVGETHTQDDGRFALGGLRRGEYLLTFEVPDAFVPPDPLPAVAGGRPVTLQLQASRAATLRVVDADGLPLVGALVKVAPDADAEEVCRVLTGADGSATVTRIVPERTYELVVHPPADRAADLLLHVGAWSARASTIVLARGVITVGLLRDAQERPAPGALVWYWTGDDPEPSSVRADAEGRFRIGPTAPGTLRLVARASSDAVAAPAREDAIPIEAGAADVELTVLR